MIRCGVDMIECARIAAGIERGGERFLNRFFTAGERQDCAGKAHRLAARFAGKEAVAKALGSGIGDVAWREIEIRTDNPRRRPSLILHGAALQLADKLQLEAWDISLSHTQTHAIAVAVALGSASVDTVRQA